MRRPQSFEGQRTRRAHPGALAAGAAVPAIYNPASQWLLRKLATAFPETREAVASGVRTIAPGVTQEATEKDYKDRLAEALNARAGSGPQMHRNANGDPIFSQSNRQSPNNKRSRNIVDDLAGAFAGH